MKNSRIVSCIFSWFLLALCPFAAHGTEFTLSDEALLSLDYQYEEWYYGQKDTSIFNIVDVPGPGVQFDFLYPDPQNNDDKSPRLYLTSSIYGGNGSLTGIDISTFDAFTLKFTVLSAQGVSTPAAVGPLVVGALINRSDAVFAYSPEVIAINDPVSATSITTTDANQIDLVGFVCNIPHWLYDESSPSPWDPDGATISLLVEPAPGAVLIIPEPATFLLLGVGVAFLRRKF